MSNISKFITVIVAVNSTILAIFIVLTFCYRYCWHVKWYCYKFFTTNSRRKIFKYRHTNDSEYNVYFSSAEEDSEWFEELINKFVMQSITQTSNDPLSVGYTATKIDEFDQNSTENLDITTDSFLLPSKRSNIRYDIYYEKRDAHPHLSQIGQMGKAIFSSRNTVVAVSLSYLNSAKHQFELDLIQQAMMKRYGYFANSHVIFMTLEKWNNFTSLLPRHLCKHYETTALTWNREDLVQQRQFWTEFNDKFEK